MKSKLILRILGFAAVIMLLCVFSVNSFASQITKPIDVDISIEKQSYSVGETIFFRNTVRNTTFSDVKNVVIKMDVPKTDRFFTGGITERKYENIGAGEIISDEFKLVENNIVLSVAAAGGAIIVALLLFFTRSYIRISAIIVTLSLLVSGAVNAPADALSNLKRDWIEYPAEECSFIYDGVEYTVGFSVFCMAEKSADITYTYTGTTSNNYTISADISAENDYNGIVFAAKQADNSYYGNLFFINSQRSTAGVLKSTKDGYTMLCERKVDIIQGSSYKLEVNYTDGRAICTLYNNPLDTEPYPLFDIEAGYEGNEYGYRCKNGTKTNISLTQNGNPAEYATYTNPIVHDAADPYILTVDGVYYMYATYLGDGIKAWSSTDLVNWTDQGKVADKNDITGEYCFWAPEVYSYNGSYYMFYSSEEHICMAMSNSPLGPFVSPVNSFYFDYKAIDSNLFFDDDGKIYMYFTTYQNGYSSIWGCEMNPDLLSYKAETLTELTSPAENEGSVNEGASMIKHNGIYYLTYTANGYTSPAYGSSYAYGSSPLGEFTKYKYNPIIKSNVFIHGTGHHCFVMSPDGSEMFIVYHCHNSLTTVEVRKICIDRVKFVPSSNGIDILTVYGPTTTSQKIPS